MVHRPYVLAIYVKGQMLESRIKIRYPLHVDIFMLTFKQGLECPKSTCNEVGTMFQIHVIHITLVDLDTTTRSHTNTFRTYVNESKHAHIPIVARYK